MTRNFPLNLSKYFYKIIISMGRKYKQVSGYICPSPKWKGLSFEYKGEPAKPETFEILVPRYATTISKKQQKINIFGQLLTNLLIFLTSVFCFQMIISMGRKYTQVSGYICPSPKWKGLSFKPKSTSIRLNAVMLQPIQWGRSIRILIRIRFSPNFLNFFAATFIFETINLGGKSLAID